MRVPEVSAVQWFQPKRHGLALRTVDVNKYYQKSPGKDPSDWKLHGDLYEEARKQWKNEGRKPWSVDAFCDLNGYNKQAGLTNFYCPRKSFFDNAEPGGSFWAHPPHRLILPTLHKFKQLVKHNSGTSMAIVTPYTPERRWWRCLDRALWFTRVRGN